MSSNKIISYSMFKLMCFLLVNWFLIGSVNSATPIYSIDQTANPEVLNTFFYNSKVSQEFSYHKLINADDIGVIFTTFYLGTGKFKSQAYDNIPGQHNVLNSYSSVQSTITSYLYSYSHQSPALYLNNGYIVYFMREANGIHNETRLEIMQFDTTVYEYFYKSSVLVSNTANTTNCTSAKACDSLVTSAIFIPSSKRLFCFVSYVYG